MKIIKTSTLLLLSIFFNNYTFASQEVTVYTARKSHLIKPLFDQFTTETGIKVHMQTGEAPALIERIKSEGEKTPADILMTVDVGNLWQAGNENLLQTIKSEKLNTAVPANLRAPDGSWYGLSLRARTIIFNPNKVKASQLSTYEDLADSKWEKKLCLRTSKKVYNQSLVAMMIAHNDVEKVENTIKGWVKNLAAPVFASDTDVIKAVDSGLCDVGIINTYYFGSYQKENPKTQLALFWPNQKQQGAHVNISGAGITKHSKQKDNAIKLLEWLATDAAQNLFASLNMEYPVNPKVKAVKEVNAWGTFKADQLNIINAGRNQTTAIRVMDKAGYL